jgi:gas vesicle protein
MGRVLLGVVAGIAAGATVGLLFAPEKGTEMRRIIREKGEELKNNVTNKFKKTDEARGHADDLLMT